MPLDEAVLLDALVLFAAEAVRELAVVEALLEPLTSIATASVIAAAALVTAATVRLRRKRPLRARARFLCARAPGREGVGGRRLGRSSWGGSLTGASAKGRAPAVGDLVKDIERAST